MLNKRLIVALLAIVILFLGIFSFAQGNQDDDGDNKDNEVNEKNEIPVITLTGENEVTIQVGEAYTDAGATASDKEDGDLTSKIVVTNSINVNIVGNYTISYNVTDNDEGKAAEVTRLVHVVDTTRPVITINGDATINHEVKTEYIDLGARAQDNYDGNITNRITTVGTVDINTLGTYNIRYNVTDVNGNVAVAVNRTVNVVDTTRPVITINGDATIRHEVKTEYIDLGAKAQDNNDGDLTDRILITGTVDKDTLGTYYIRYNVTDNKDNQAVEMVRTVIVEDTTDPVVSFNLNGKDSWDKVGKSTVTITDNYDLNESSLKYLWNDSTVTPSESDFTNTFTNGTELSDLSGLTGEYYLWILAVDNANNKIITSSKKFNLDNTAPTTPTIDFNGYVNGTWTNSDINLEFSATDTHSGILKYQRAASSTAVDSDWTDITSPYLVNTSLDETFYIRTVDKVGNVSLPTEAVIIKSDIDAPKIEIESHAGTDYEQNYNVSVTVDELPSSSNSGLATLKYLWSVTSTNVTDFSSASDFTLTGNTASIPTDLDLTGVYYLWIQAVDNVGNSSISRSDAYHLDNEDPTITNVTGNPTSWVTSATLTVSATDNIGVVEYSFDNGVNWQPSNSKTFYNNGAINVIVRDSAGNESVPYPTININKIDNDNPSISLHGDSTVTLMRYWYWTQWKIDFTDPGYDASDMSPLTHTKEIIYSQPYSTDTTVVSNVTPNIGKYVITYTVTDAVGKSASISRTVYVIRAVDAIYDIDVNVGKTQFDVCTAETCPTIGLSELQVTAYDYIDGTFLSKTQIYNIAMSGTVNIRVVGDYPVTITATDWRGIQKSVNKTIKVRDNVPPVITITDAKKTVNLYGTQVNVPIAQVTDNYYTGLESTIKYVYRSELEYMNVFGAKIPTGNKKVYLDKIIYYAKDGSGNAAERKVYETDQYIMTTGVFNEPISGIEY